MRLLTSISALFFSICLVNAATVHDHAAIVARHAKLGFSKRETALDARATSGKRCPSRVSKHKNTTTPVSLAGGNKASSKSIAPSSTKSKATPTPTPTKKNTNQLQQQSAGVIKVKSNCGSTGATKDITKLSGPNGHIDWLNCGFESDSGWQPPNVRAQDIITQSLHTALQSPSTPFKACASYIWIFEKYANMHNIPPIILASFAMQESSCNPNTVGGGGEQGLMQITQEKCAGAPGGNCKDPEFNIATAAKYFAETLNGVGGNILLAVGKYNGWYSGLTKWKAFAAARSSCCRCQNNGDYLHQFFNGWVQNINAYDRGLGKYFNLNVC